MAGESIFRLLHTALRELIDRIGTVEAAWRLRTSKSHVCKRLVKCPCDGDLAEGMLGT